MCRDRGRPLTARSRGWRVCSTGLHATMGLPQAIVVDNGPEFAGRTLDAWAYARGVTLRFIRPGKPIENAYVESFNGKFRDECLNEHWFVSLADAEVDDRSVAGRLQHASAHTARWTGLRRSSLPEISEGARRLTPARPDTFFKYSQTTLLGLSCYDVACFLVTSSSANAQCAMAGDVAREFRVSSAVFIGTVFGKSSHLLDRLPRHE